MPSMAERGGDFSGNPLTGSVDGAVLGGAAVARDWADSYGGRAISAVFPDGKISDSAWAAPAKNLLASLPQPNAGGALFSTSAEAETLTDNKGAVRTDWTHGKSTLTAYYFLDDYSLDNPYPTGTGGASVPGFNATSKGARNWRAWPIQLRSARQH